MSITKAAKSTRLNYSHTLSDWSDYCFNTQVHGTITEVEVGNGKSNMIIKFPGGHIALELKKNRLNVLSHSNWSRLCITLMPLLKRQAEHSHLSIEIWNPAINKWNWMLITYLSSLITLRQFGYHILKLFKTNCKLYFNASKNEHCMISYYKHSLNMKSIPSGTSYKSTILISL